MISYQTEGIEMPAIKKRETTEWIKKVAADYGKRVGEIAYIFCSDEKILEVTANIYNMIIIRISLLSTIVPATVFRAIYSSAWILSARMQSNSTNRMSGSFTASLYMVSCISAASMTRVPENAK